MVSLNPTSICLTYLCSLFNKVQNQINGKGIGFTKNGTETTESLQQERRGGERRGESGGISWWQRSTWEGRGPSSIQGSSAQSTSDKKRSSHNIWLWKSGGTLFGRDGGLLETQASIYWACTQTHWHSLKAPKMEMHQALWGETKLYGFKESVGGAATIVPLWSPTVTQTVGVDRGQIWIYINLARDPATETLPHPNDELPKPLTAAILHRQTAQTAICRLS